jgi:hypothetical protein
VAAGGEPDGEHESAEGDEEAAGVHGGAESKGS